MYEIASDKIEPIKNSDFYNVSYIQDLLLNGKKYQRTVIAVSEEEKIWQNALGCQETYFNIAFGIPTKL